MKTKISLTIVMVIFLIQGCVVKSIHPFYTPQDLIFRKEITGKWMDRDSSVWVIAQHMKSTGLFKPDKPDNSYDITYISDDGTARFIAHLFELDKILYLDFYPSDISCGNDMANYHMIGAHSLAKVSLAGGKISISWYNEEWLADLFRSNKIRISHESSPYSYDDPERMQYILTASTTELQKFIRKYGTDPAAFQSNDSKSGSGDYTFVLSRKVN